MIRFSPEFHENFVQIIWKYMRLRGDMKQTELASKLNVAPSTISRFLNVRTVNVDESLVAQIIAILEIPLHEVIDWVEEDSTERLKRLVKVYKDQQNSEEESAEPSAGPSESRTKTTATINIGGKKQQMAFGEATTGPVARAEMSMKEKLETLSPRQKAYLNDFLNLDVNDRDLIVDLGESIFRYFRQRNIQF
jgi:transcriptional regulator with XRE-family HTH domain